MRYVATWTETVIYEVEFESDKLLSEQDSLAVFHEMEKYQPDWSMEGHVDDRQLTNLEVDPAEGGGA